MSIEDRAMQDVESWVPEEGAMLSGKIVAIGTLEGDYGPYPSIEIEDKTGKCWRWHAFDTVAKNELASQKPVVGDEIAARFIGEKPTKPGSKYKSYKAWRVIIEKPEGPIDVPDWGAVGEEAAEEGANEFQPFPDDDALTDEPF